MNNQQIQFSVKVNKEAFLVKAKEACNYYLSKTTIKDKVQEENENRLLNICKLACRSSLNLSQVSNGLAELQNKVFNHNTNIANFHNAQKVLCTIGMVNISSDEFVYVTEDIYNLIYECDS